MEPTTGRWPSATYRASCKCRTCGTTRVFCKERLTQTCCFRWSTCRPAASQGANEAFGMMGSHSDGQGDAYGNSSQDSTLMMREVSAVTWLRLTASEPSVTYENTSHYPRSVPFCRSTGVEQLFEIKRLTESKQTIQTFPSNSPSLNSVYLDTGPVNRVFSLILRIESLEISRDMFFLL